MRPTSGMTYVTSAFGNRLYRSRFEWKEVKHGGFQYDDCNIWDFDVEGCRKLLFTVVLENLCQELIEGESSVSEKDLCMYCECINIEIDYLRRLIKESPHLDRMFLSQYKIYSHLFEFHGMGYSKNALKAA